ncbi:MAG: branched-chain amino acid ABC transporter permease [Proteobacteria bacterium]|nr:branched-chain amino acid ABC transporter permease [Pseudomonadota bacterium]NBY21138.1 branched-chain amino acid ABC transporter permease [bacterium]
MKRFQTLVLIAVVALLWGLNYLFEENLNPYVLRVIINCGIGMILAMSLNLVNGCAGQFSLGHAGFMGVGAYISATITSVLNLSPFFQTDLGVGCAIVIGGIVASIAGYLVGLPSLRLKGDYLAIVTLGFGEIIRICFLNIEAVGGARGLSGIPPKSNFFWVYLWVVVTFIALLRLLRSSYGRAILSVRENEIAAESMGIDISHYKVVAFVVSSFFAGIAGGLFAHFQSFIDPNSFVFNKSVEAVIMVVIGGMGSLSGAILGGVIVTLLPEVLRVFEQYRMVIFPLILIVLMLVRPMGLFGHKEIWELFRRKASS